MDDSVEIVPSEDGSSFTVVDTGLPNTHVYSVEPMSKGEKVGLSLLGTALLGVLGAVGYFSYKEDKKLKAEAAERQAEMKRKREERQEWFDAQRREGRTVIETIDGEYLAIPNEAYTKAEIRKKAL